MLLPTSCGTSSYIGSGEGSTKEGGIWDGYMWGQMEVYLAKDKNKNNLIWIRIASFMKSKTIKEPDIFRE